MSDLCVRRYQGADQAVCLAIFDGLVPRFFAPEERPEFAGFLDDCALGVAPYLVLLHAGRVVACGGYALHGARARLTWGMVAREVQGTGLGRALTAARLDILRAMAGVEAVEIETSQHTAGFYQRFGFDVVRVLANGFGPGLDRWEMTLALDHTVRRDGVDSPDLSGS